MRVALSTEEFSFTGDLCINLVLHGLQLADRLFSASDSVVMLDLEIVDSSAELLILCLQIHDLAFECLNSFVSAGFGRS